MKAVFYGVFSVGMLFCLKWVVLALYFLIQIIFLWGCNVVLGLVEMVRCRMSYYLCHIYLHTTTRKILNRLSYFIPGIFTEIFSHTSFC
jgi:hypothetical protein